IYDVSVVAQASTVSTNASVMGATLGGGSGNNGGGKYFNGGDSGAFYYTQAPSESADWSVADYIGFILRDTVRQTVVFVREEGEEPAIAAIGAVGVISGGGI